MESKITSKYQVTIPKEIRKTLKLKEADLIEWKIEGNKIMVEAVSKPFLKHSASIKLEPGRIKDDIKKARNNIVSKFQ
ncbi:MAG: AbrB/MazE/SpoVT family DNA-binding domain-containing protein [Thermodesulfobacteriota bacterium]